MLVRPWLLPCLAALGGCSAILGLDEFEDTEGAGAAGVSASSSAAASTSGSGGSGGVGGCSAGQMQACYSGPPGTDGNAPCKAGSQACVDGAWGECDGEVLPGTETCASNVDENCNGSACGVTVWAHAWGDLEHQFAAEVGTDASGNVYLFGNFYGAVQFGSMPLVSSGVQDLYLVKLDAAGDHVWSKRFGDAAAQTSEGLAVDAAGNIAITGYFDGSLDFGGGPLAASGNDVFVAKLDTSGALVWATKLGGVADQRGRGVAMDSTGHVVVVGTYVGSPDFGTGAFPAPAVGDTGLFAAKLDAATGATVWANGYAAPGDQAALAVAIDPSDSILWAGTYSGTLGMGCVQPLPAAPDTDVFLAKHDAGGNCAWLKAFGGTGETYAADVAVDATGSVVLAGRYATSFDQTSLGASCPALTAAGSSDAYLARFSANGSCLWSKSFGGVGFEEATSVAIAPGGTIWLGGRFTNINLGGADFTTAGDDDIFLGAFDPSGTHLWSGAWGDPTEQEAHAVAVAPDGDVLYFGETKGVFDFGTGPLPFGGGIKADVWLARIGGL